MPQSVTHCPVCGGGEFQEVERFTAPAMVCTYVACSSCGLVRMNPSPTDDELSSYYSGRYWEGRTVTEAMAKQARFTRYVQSFIEARAPRGFCANVLSVLEVGSSFGVTLSEVGRTNRARGGRATLYAIEPSAHAIQAGGTNYEHIRVLGTSLEAVTDRLPPHLGLVIFSHVIEHFRDPVVSLRTLVDSLNESSLVYVEVPNYFGHPSVDYAHNFCFTETSLRNTLGAAGLSVVAQDLFHHDPEFPVYLTCLARKADAAFAPVAESVEDIRRKRTAAKREYSRYLFLKHPTLALRRMLSSSRRTLNRLGGSKQ